MKVNNISNQEKGIVSEDRDGEEIFKKMLKYKIDLFIYTYGSNKEAYVTY